MTRLLIAWFLHKLAESDAINARLFAARLEENWRAAERYIPIADQRVADRGSRYRNLRLARRYPVSDKALLSRTMR